MSYEETVKVANDRKRKREKTVNVFRLPAWCALHLRVQCCKTHQCYKWQNAFTRDWIGTVSLGTLSPALTNLGTNCMFVVDVHLVATSSCPYLGPNLAGALSKKAFTLPAPKGLCCKTQKFEAQSKLSTFLNPCHILQSIAPKQQKKNKKKAALDT